MNNKNWKYRTWRIFRALLIILVVTVFFPVILLLCANPVNGPNILSIKLW